MYLNGQPFAKIEGNEIYYYHNDHIGTPLIMTADNASQAWEGAYLPFGDEHVITGSITNNIRFPGQYYDSETGMHYNYFRDYNPEIGRYVKADPIGLSGGTNLYTYVGNDPVNWIDPWGLMELPSDPSALDPNIWKPDPKHRDPNGTRYRDPSGRPLDWNPKKPGASPNTWAGKDHWHDPNNTGKRHLRPGTSIPNPSRPVVVPPIMPSSGFYPPLPILVIPICAIMPSLPECQCQL